LYGSQQKALAHSVRPFLEHALPILPILSRTQYDSSIHTSTPPFIRQNVNYVTESTRQLIILHSSGSTGLPKPINFTHKRLFIMFRSAQPYIAFQTGPLSHTQSLMTHVQAIYARKTLYLWNGHVAQTSGTLTKAIVAAQPELVWTVPYVLKLLAEEKAGIEALRRANQVCAAGSRCPDDLGDMLVQEGVNLGLTFGT
jgi:acyl-coenzyme A synthetase/AMP-(fatty) acid ligase